MLPIFAMKNIRRASSGTKNFMRLAGIIKNGPRDLSTRKGFATPISFRTDCSTTSVRKRQARPASVDS
jgi:hypothetical protein